MLKQTKYITAVVVAFNVLLLSRVFYHIINGTRGYLTVPIDDFYYYLAIAKNIFAHGFSTYDGVIVTNGYHPLWLGIVVFIVGIAQSEQVFFAILSIVCFSCSMATYYLLRHICYVILKQNYLSASALLLGSVFYSWMMTWAMEITIAVPLYLLAIVKLHNILYDAKKTNLDFFKFGLLLSLGVLARLDLGIFIALVLTTWIYLEIRGKNNNLLLVRRGIYVAIGLLPIVMYIAVNYFLFGTAYTTAIVAKTMKINAGFSSSILMELLKNSQARLVLTLLLPTIASCVFLRRRNIPPIIPLSLLPLICFPLFYFLIYGFSSDWILFVWYTFTFPPIIAFEIFYIGEALRFSNPVIQRAIGYSSFIAIVVFFGFQFLKTTNSQTFNWNPLPSTIFRHAEVLHTFVSTHPGKYAMGDRAGLTQYMLEIPLFQAEGLTEDFEYLSHINKQMDLRSTLKTLHIDYLILSKFHPLQLHNDSFYVEMPFWEQAGLNSKKMSSNIKAEDIVLLDKPDTIAYPFDSKVFTYVVTL